MNKLLMKNITSMRVLNLTNKKDDHKPIMMDYKFRVDLTNNSIHDTHSGIPNIDWSNENELEEYRIGVEKYLNEIMEEIKAMKDKYGTKTIFDPIDSEQASLELSVMLNNLSYTMLKSKSDISERKLKEKQNKKASKHNKYNKDLDDQLIQLHKTKCDAYRKWKNTKPKMFDSAMRPQFKTAEKNFTHYRNFLEKNKLYD